MKNKEQNENVEIREKKYKSKLESLLQIQIPLTVVLAEKKMRLEEIIELAPGAVIEFEKSIDSPLELRIGNKPIACGDAIKIAEKFGLQIRDILPQKDRLRAMGQI